MTICIHCGNENFDDDFCDICGRKITEDEPIIEQFRDYIESTVECVIKKSTMKKNERLLIESDLIKVPIEVQQCGSKEKENLLYFLKDDSVSLKSYLEQNFLEHDDLVTIMIRVYRIIKELNDQNFILGSFDIADLWLKNENLSTLYLRQTRRFLKKPQDLMDYEPGEIEGIGIINLENGEVELRSDISLLGKLYITLSTGMKYQIENYFHERYIAYNLGMFSKISENYLHTWLDKTTSVSSEKKYKTLEECMDDFEYLLQLSYVDQNSNQDIKIEIASETNVGIGKNFKMQGVPENMRNEDSILVRKDITSENEKILLLVADGVSTSTVGTGYQASNIVKSVANDIWLDKYKDINNETDVQLFVEEVIIKSNKLIWEYAYSQYGEDAKKHVIMATTMSIAVIIDNKLYCASVGDSPMMLFEKNYVVPLNYIDNKGNETLVYGCSWDRFNSMDGASTLTKFIGGYNSSKEVSEINFPVVREIELIQNQFVLICSDGLTDYIGVGMDLEINWATDQKIKNIIYQNEESHVKEIVNELIKTANNNGGGDNISCILIKTK